MIQPIQSSSFGLSRELRRVTVKKVLPKPVDSAACDGQRIPFFQNKNPSDPHFFVFKHNIFSSDLLVKRNSHLVVLHKTRNSPNSKIGHPRHVYLWIGAADQKYYIKAASRGCAMHIKHAQFNRKSAIFGLQIGSFQGRSFPTAGQRNEDAGYEGGQR